MSLTKRQKRRLSELAKMIDKSSGLRDDMTEIQSEYIKEIDEAILLIKKARTEPEILHNPQESDLSGLPTLKEDQNEQKSSSDSKKTESNSIEYQSEPDLLEIPSWAKRLWKEIAKECHPDRVNFMKMTAIEVAKRQQWFLESRKALEEEQWSKLLYIGVQLSVWVKELSHNTQIDMLNSEYDAISAKVHSIQNSIAWKWGTNWDNHDLRAQILQVVCTHRGIPVLPKVELIKVLLKLEIE